MKRIKFLVILIVLQLMAPLEIFAVSPQPGVPPEEAGAAIAVDPISTEKRTVYFMRYPNGVEEATEDKTVADKAEERLIYEGTTNENGEIILNNYNSEGQLRIVEEVPDGYSTSKREMNVDLSNNSTTSFTNYKGLINPNTGRTFIIAIVAILLILITISITQRKHKTNALILLILPIISFVIAGMFQNVNAETKNFIITVKDNHGNKMPNVAIKIYAKPIVERDNSIKFSAGDGYFFDGTKEMYFRLPSQECTFEEFYNTLTAEQQQYLNMNWEFSYLDGNLRLNGGIIDDLLKRNDVVSYSTTITTLYDRRDINLVTIYGNGGYVDFFGKKLTEMHVYEDMVESLGQLFTKADSYNIGLDTSEKCGNYNQYGMKIQDQRVVQTYYTCWNTKPDGIYINNQFFKGTDDTCYKESNIKWADDNFELYYPKSGKFESYFFEIKNAFAFYNVTESRSELSVSFLYPKAVVLLSSKDEKPIDKLRLANDYGKLDSEASYRKAVNYDAATNDSVSKSGELDPSAIVREVVYGEPINSISIVENGREIVSISKEDIECTGTGKYTGKYNDEVESRCTIPTKHRQALVEYLTNMKNSCVNNNDLPPAEEAGAAFR